MISPRQPPKFLPASFRARLVVAMMLVVVGITALALYFAQGNVAANVEHKASTAFDSCR